MRVKFRHAAALTSVGVLALAGCSADAVESDGLSVVATTTQIADITSNVIGDAAEMHQLLQPGESAHSYDPTPEALQALATADVLVINGAGLESWLQPVLDSSGFDGQVIDASENVHPLEGDHSDHDHGDEEHADHDHGDDDHGADEHTDPHIWTDPHNVEHMVETIAAGLTEAAPDSADAIEQNAAAYAEKLATLDTWMHEAFETVPVEDRLLITNHNTFGYLAAANDITIVGSVLPAFDDNAEVSAAAIDALVAQIEETGAKAVFSESQLDAQLAETIANEAGVEVYSGEQALYTDALGAAGTDGETYIGSQVHNTSLMVEAWGGTVPDVPEELR